MKTSCISRAPWKFAVPGKDPRMTLVESRRGRAGSQSARAARRLGILAGALSLVFTGNASAATTQIGRAAQNATCVNGLNYVQATTAWKTPSYRVPAGGGFIKGGGPS